MADRGKAGSKRTRQRIMAAYFKGLAGTYGHYPTITELARKFNVTTPTIYNDLENLRCRLGSLIIPIGLKLGGKKYVKRF